VQIHELGQVDDSYFIAMEYVFGRDMARIIPKAEKMGIAFPAVYALKIASSVCEGLHYAHERSDAWGTRCTSCTATSLRRTSSSPSTGR
jgi:serine/threonine-protein kinase